MDPVGEPDLRAHRKILSTDTMVIIENLCHLKDLPQGIFQLSVLPLKYLNADGAPIRAIAQL